MRLVSISTIEAETYVAYIRVSRSHQGRLRSRSLPPIGLPRFPDLNIGTPKARSVELSAIMGHVRTIGS